MADRRVNHSIAKMSETVLPYLKSKIKQILVIILSLVTYVLSNGEWSIPILAWVYPALFLWIVYLIPSSKVYVILFGIYAVGFMIRFEKIIGMGFWVCIVAAVLTAFLNSLPYVFWKKSRRDFQATILFAVGMVIVEFVICRIYPILGGLSDAYTQYKTSLLLQVVTVTGVHGISFIMYWTAAVVIWFCNKRNELHRIKTHVSIYLAIMGVVLVYGAIMLHTVGTEANSVRIAGITVPVSDLLNEDEDVYSVFYTNSFTDENRINAKMKLSEVVDELFQKTVQEAQADAKIVFWSELNGAVLKDEEAALLQRASHIAKEQDIYLVVSLLVKTPYSDLKENKTVVFAPQGKMVSEYYKFGRSIGELCQKGDGKLKSFDTEYGRIAPFICSDMAFSSQIRQAGKNDVDILIVPASDWKEMTDIAIRTAVMRGVENGCNVVRHTNNGKSIVSDFSGTILAQADYFQSDTKTIAAQVLTSGRLTVYSQIGDVFVYLCFLYLLVVCIRYTITSLRRIQP